MLVLLGLGTCLAVVSPDKPPQTGPSATAQAEAPAKPKAADHKMTANALSREYAKNEVRADAKYKGKLVEVTGIVHSVNKDAFGGIYVVMGNGGEFDTNEIHCSLGRGWEDSAAKLMQGYKATLRGEVTGRVMLSAMLDDCEILTYWTPQ